MDISELERLAEMVQRANIRELTLREGKSRITIRKNAVQESQTGGALVVSSGEMPYFTETAENGVALDFTDSDEYDAYEEADTDDVEEALWIMSPIVGIFRHVKPLIGLGARVTAGQVIGLVQTMDVVTDVKAEAEGVVVDVLIEDGMPVEYGQSLFEIRSEA